MTVEEVQLEKQSFPDSNAKKHYFLGDNLHNDKHCFIDKGDVTNLCRRLGVDAYTINVMNREQIRDVNSFLKTGGFEQNTEIDGNSLQIGGQNTYIGANKVITHHTLITHQHIFSH